MRIKVNRFRCNEIDEIVARPQLQDHEKISETKKRYTDRQTDRQTESVDINKISLVREILKKVYFSDVFLTKEKYLLQKKNRCLKK